MTDDRPRRRSPMSISMELDEMGLTWEDVEIPAGRWLTKVEAARRARVTIRTIERAIERRDLAAGGTPGLVLIEVAELERWIHAREELRRRRRQP